MPRQKRLDVAGGIYHALNRGNAREDIFHKEEDYAAFQRVPGEGLQRYDVRLFSYTLMLSPGPETAVGVEVRYKVGPESTFWLDWAKRTRQCSRCLVSGESSWLRSQRGYIAG
jgi:hypothetical protein